MDEKQLHAIPQLLNAEAETISTEYNIADAADKVTTQSCSADQLEWSDGVR